MRYLFVLLTVLGLAGCVGLPVTTDYAPGADFSALKTYAWLPETDTRVAAQDPEANNDLVRERVRSAVDAQLAARGYRLLDAPAGADMLVTYHNGLKDRVVVDNQSNWHSHFGYYPCYHCFNRPGFGAYSDPYFFPSYSVREYTENTLIIDIIDPASKSLLWRGTAKRSQPYLETPEDRRLYVLETVAAILAEFPPGAGGEGH